MVDTTQKIVLDTNFLLIPAQFGVDIFVELEKLCNFKFELYLVDKTLKELENVVKTQKGAQKDAAKLTISLITSKKIGIIETFTGYVDDILVEEGKKGAIIATQDKELKQRLKQENIKIIILRQKKYLTFG